MKQKRNSSRNALASMGMLSVNGFTGEVWPHTWHGTDLGQLGSEIH